MYRFIVNPAARSWRSYECWDRLEAVLKKEHIPYTVSFTEAPSHATRLAAELTGENYDPEDIIGVLGGDGTLNEVTAGLNLSREPRIFYVPCGSGNDFARGSHLKINADNASEYIRHPEKLSEGFVDVGTIQLPGRLPRRFVVSSGVGFDAAVCYDMVNSRVKAVCNKLHCGKLSYVILGLKNMLFCPLVRGELLIDDGAETIIFKNLAFLSAHNLPYEGGGFFFAPKATSEDGLLDLCVVTAPLHLKFIYLLAASLFNGAHIRKKGVTYRQCRKVEVRLKKKLAVHTDGEIHGLFDRVVISTYEGHFRILK